jgi:hypothetical protein
MTTFRCPIGDFESEVAGSEKSGHKVARTYSNSSAWQFLAPAPASSQAHAPSGPTARKRRGRPEFDSDQCCPGFKLLSCNRDGPL